MFTSKQGVARAASAIVLLISLISTGMVVAHQCHQSSTQVATHAHHDEPTSSATPNSSLLTDICIGVTFLVLLIGGKFWLRKRVSSWLAQAVSQIKDLRRFVKPPNLVLALTLPQLGIYRI
jgi:hypothetical protein